MPALSVRSRALVALLALTVVACFPEGVTNVGKKAAKVSANTVPAATAPVASSAAPIPSVIVKDGRGKPVSGVPVTFTVMAGGGAITGASQTTNAQGIAAVGGWTMGTVPGEQRLSAKPDSLGAVAFVVTAMAGAPAQLSKVSGDGQNAAVGSAVVSPVTVAVKDSYGNAVSGATVAFAPTNGSTATPATAATNASGQATTQWTMATVPGGASLTVSLGSLTPVIFSATAVAGAAVAPMKMGDGQSATVGSTLANPVGIAVKDSYGNPLAGVAVNFTAWNGSSVTPVTVNTDGQGIAVTSWKMGSVAGASSLTANVGSFSVAFSATALAGQPAKFVLLDYPSNSTVGSTLPNVGLMVMDDFGNALEGVEVTFTSGNGSSAQPAIVRSDAAGKAVTQWTMGTTAGTMMMTASANGVPSRNYSVIASAGPASQLVKQREAANGAPGASQSLGIYVRDSYGNAVSGAAVTFTPANGSTVSPASPVSDASGLAVTSWTFGPASGSQSVSASAGSLASQTFTATVTAPVNLCASHGVLAQPGTVTGDLTNSQCDYDPGHSVIDLWTLNLSGSKPVEIDHEAVGDAFDTYLTLYKGQYTGTKDAIGFNDDGFTACCNSRIRFLGGAGTFLVGATHIADPSFQDRGPYNLSIKTWSGAVTACDTVFAAVGTNTNQVLDTDDCRLSLRNADRVMVYLKAGESVRLTMKAATFDAKLEVHQLVSGRWTMVASDDNSAGGTDAQLTFTAPASDYYFVYMTSVLNGVGGNYSFAIDTPPAGVASRMMPVGASIAGESAQKVQRDYVSPDKIRQHPRGASTRKF